MPCPYAGAGDSRETVDRDDFLRSTLVIGGGDALQATLMRYGPPEPAPSGAPPATGGQYDWGATDPADDADHDHDGDGETGGTDECPVDHAEDDDYDDFESDWPAYHVVYRLTHEGDHPETARRRLVEGLWSVTEQVGWSGDGVAWAVGYAPRFLEESDAPVPATLRSAPVESVAPDGGRPAGGDCLLHLASDEPRTLLVAEAALWGETEGVGVDVTVPDPVDDAFPRPTSAPDRRVTLSPHGVDAPAVEGDAVIELSAFEADGDERAETRPMDDDHDDAAECPVDHDETGDGHDAADDDRGHSSDDHDHDQAGDHDHADDAVDLRHLNPASPGVLRVALRSLDASDPDAERYYLPSAEDRAPAGE